MNPYATLAGTIIAQVIVAVYVYGKLSQRVADQGGWLKRHDGDLAKHDRALNNHERRISHMEGRKGIAIEIQEPSD